MWPRIVEVMLAVWLAISPFVFRYGSDEAGLWANDFICAALIATFALVSYIPRLERSHLAELAVAAWLVTLAFLQPDIPPGPPHQNHLAVGLLLLIFAILPSRCNQPPRAWREFYDQRSQQR